MNVRRLQGLLLACLLLSGSCSESELRGRSVPSADGTYLVVDAYDGDGCTPGLRVDGREWPAQLHQPAAIEPGFHTIACHGQATIQFEIRRGTTFHFDYWGP